MKTQPVLFHSQKTTNRGAALIEMAVVVPIVIFTIFAAFTLIEIMRDRMVLQSLAQHMAYSAKKDCLPRFGVDLTVCTHKTAVTFDVIAKRMLPRFAADGGLALNFWKDTDGMTHDNGIPDRLGLTGSLNPQPQNKIGTINSSYPPIAASPPPGAAVTNFANATGGLVAAEFSYNSKIGVASYEVAYS
jgi:hypothetical protein